MDKSGFWAGLAVMAGLIVSGIMLPVAVRQFKAADRVVAVKGLCEREVKADKAIWPVRFKVAGNDLSQVYEDMERKNAQVKEFLISGGIKASEITVSIPSVSDKYAQEYGTNDRTYRYVATSIVTVCTSDVDKVLELMPEQTRLVKMGIAPESDWESKPLFSFEGLNAIKPEMIQEATQNAREVALKFASDSHSRLGKIKTASQGNFSIEDRDSYTPQIKKVRVVTSVTYQLSK